MQELLSKYSASVSELKKNPSALLVESEGDPIVILNHNTPSAYFLSAAYYEELLNYIEDLELAQVCRERESEKADAVEIDLNVL